jgi:hypothetical protein
MNRAWANNNQKSVIFTSKHLFNLFSARYNRCGGGIR